MRSSQSELRLDLSEQRPAHLLIGRAGTYMRISPSAQLLLELVRRGQSFRSIAEVICRQSSRQVSADEVAAAYHDLCRRIAAIEEKSATTTHGGFWFRCRLLPAPLVTWLAARLSWAFHPLVAAPLVCAVAIAAGLILRLGGPSDPGHFWPAYGLFLLSLLFHELGHASACARYGAAPREIGLTAYLIYPAFYSNVSAAWTLRRWQRVLVDLGGVYFQLLFGAACALFYLFLRHECLYLCLTLIAGSCLLSLNPVLKFDGYWLVADLLGVSNLDQQPRRIYEQVLNRLRGRAVQPLPWPPGVTCLLALYAVVSTCFWLLFCVRVIPALWSCARAYPEDALKLARHLHSATGWQRWDLLGSFLASSYMLLFLTFISGRLTASLLRWVRVRWLGRSSNR